MKLFQLLEMGVVVKSGELPRKVSELDRIGSDDDAT
jgi:hypothetical protein